MRIRGTLAGAFSGMVKCKKGKSKFIEGEHEISLEVPNNTDKNICNSKITRIREGKDVTCILEGGNVNIGVRI